MKILTEFPPNIAEIRQIFPVDKYNPVFAYGDILYNPYNTEIPPDLELHENVHRNQQENNPAIWWTKYCLDPKFRLEQEIEAYSAQYQFIKKHTIEKIYSEALDEFAEQLASPMYSLTLSKDRAKTLIRKYGKN